MDSNLTRRHFIIGGISLGIAYYAFPTAVKSAFAVTGQSDLPNQSGRVWLTDVETESTDTSLSEILQQEVVYEGKEISEVLFGETEYEQWIDSTGRTVNIPNDIKTVSPLNNCAQAMLLMIEPSLLLTMVSKYSESDQQYIANGYHTLPVSDIIETASGTEAEQVSFSQADIAIIISKSKAYCSDTNFSIQEGLNMPTICINSKNRSIPEIFIELGKILKREERAEELANYINGIYDFIIQKQNATTYSIDQTVYYGAGPTGLLVGEYSGLREHVLSFVTGGLATLVPSTSDSRQIDIDELYSLDPDIIILGNQEMYWSVINGTGGGRDWSDLQAVKNGCVFCPPFALYAWFDMPALFFQTIGALWFGSIFYPDLYSDVMREETRNFYRVMLHYEMSDDEIDRLLCTTARFETAENNLGSSSEEANSSETEIATESPAHNSEDEQSFVDRNTEDMVVE